MKSRLQKVAVVLTSAAALSIAALAADQGKAPADNTKKNERVCAGETKTPTDQSNRPEELKITQTIRHEFSAAGPSDGAVFE
jgi:hypothetical protein